jgi:hypothetical protein
MVEVLNAWCEGKGAKQVFFMYGKQVYQVEKAKVVK